MSTTLTINLPSEYWEYFNNGDSNNNPSSYNGFFFNEFYSYTTTFNFTSPYTTDDLTEYCKFSNSSYTVTNLTISFTVDNTQNKYVESSVSNTTAFYGIYSNSVSMTVNATINTPSLPNPTSQNLKFVVPTYPTITLKSGGGYSNTIYFTLPGANAVNNRSSINTIFPSYDYSVYLSDLTSTPVTAVVPSSFPLIFQITPYSDVSA